MSVFLLAVMLTLLTVVIHSAGTHVAITWGARWTSRRRGRSRVRAVWLVPSLVTFLLITHLVEAGVWALAFRGAGMLPDFATALYYSLTSYSTVGFGDVVLPGGARSLGPIEAVAGVLMMGWSTAVIVAVVQKIYRETSEVAD